MSGIERKITEWIENNICVIAFAFVFIAGCVIRTYLRRYVSNDASTFLLPWYEEIKKNGSLKGLGIQVGNYNVMYQFFIAIFTYLPIKALYSYKIFSCIFDIMLAFLGILFYRELSEQKSEWMELLIFSMIYLSPIVFLNSAAWAQCDSIYVFFCILTMYLMMKEKYGFAMCAYGLAFAFKLQAVFLLPFLLICYLRSRKFSVYKFINVFIMLGITMIPGVVCGRSFLDVFHIYMGQAKDNVGRITLNYPSFWNLLYTSESGHLKSEIRVIAVLLTVCVLGMQYIWIVKRDIQMTKSNCLWIAFLTSYSCVLFLPAMHERYGFLYEILALFIILSDKSTLKFMIPMYLCTFSTYGYYLFSKSYNIMLVSLVNVAIFLLYLVHYIKRVSSECTLGKVGSEGE